MTFCESVLNEYAESRIDINTTISLIDIFYENKNSEKDKYDRIINSIELVKKDLESLSPKEKKFLKYIESHTDDIYKLLEETENSTKVYTRDDYAKADQLDRMGFIAACISGIIMLMSSTLALPAGLIFLISAVVIAIQNYLKSIIINENIEYARRLKRALKPLESILLKAKAPDREKVPDRWYEVYEDIEGLENTVDGLIEKCERIIF